MPAQNIILVGSQKKSLLGRELRWAAGVFVAETKSMSSVFRSLGPEMVF